MNAPAQTRRAEREQRTFRALLDSMARPGSERQLPPADGREGYPALLIAEALLDHEVSFAVLPQDSRFIETVLRSTGSRISAVGEADYVFCETASLVDALRLCKEGTQEYPDRGATVVCSVDSLAQGDLLRVSGPGVPGSAVIGIGALPVEARGIFAERNAETPLGVDLVLVASDGRLVSLSRYTRVEGV